MRREPIQPIATPAGAGGQHEFALPKPTVPLESVRLVCDPTALTTYDGHQTHKSGK
jgi:hypothetical protein